MKFSTGSISGMKRSEKKATWWSETNELTWPLGKVKIIARYVYHYRKHCRWLCHLHRSQPTKVWMLVIIIPVRWFRVPNAGLTRNRLENWIYGPARPAGLVCFWTVNCWSDQHLVGYLGYMHLGNFVEGFRKSTSKFEVAYWELRARMEENTLRNTVRFSQTI